MYKIIAGFLLAALSLGGAVAASADSPQPAPGALTGGGAGHVAQIQGYDLFGYSAIPDADGTISFGGLVKENPHNVVHVLDAAGEDRVYGPAGAAAPVAVSGSYVVAATNHIFSVFDRSTGKLLTHKAVPFGPPTVPNQAWTEGDMLVVVSPNYGQCSSTVTYLQLPNLDTSKTIPFQFVGQILPWHDGYVGVGYKCGVPRDPGVPVVVTLQRATFSIQKQAQIPISLPRDWRDCALYAGSAPVISGDLLIYGADCGGVRVFDLSKMAEDAQQAPFPGTTFLRFAVQGSKLLAVRTDAGGGIATEFELPSLKLLGTRRFPGDYLAVSAGNTYTFQRVPPKPENPSVTIYPGFAALAPDASIAQSLMVALRKAHQVLNSTGDVYQAIATVGRSGSIPAPTEVRSLPPEVRRAMTWYAGLLLDTHTGSEEGMALLQALQAASPKDADLDALIRAAGPWQAALSGSDQPTLQSLAAQADVFTGQVRGAIAFSPHYLVTVISCGDDRSSSLTPITGTDVARRALKACHSGAEAGIGIYDGTELTMRAYVPVAASGQEDEVHPGSIVILGDMAYAVINGGDKSGQPNLFAVDLKKASVIATGNVGGYGQLRVVSGQLIACPDEYPQGGDCQVIDPSTLATRHAFAGLSVPDPMMSDSMLEQITGRGLGDYADKAVAITDMGLLIDGPAHGMGIVRGPESPVSTVDTDLDGTERGVSSPNGRYAYIYGSRPGFVAGSVGRVRITRVDMTTGEMLDLADGGIQPLTLVRVGPLLAYQDGEAIEVRDAATGQFLCTWPSPSDSGLHIMDTYSDPAAKVFLVVRLPRFSVDTSAHPMATSFEPDSWAFDVPRFVAQSQACGRQSQAAQEEFAKALARLAP